MGAWGYQPWETDQAADWFHKILKGVEFGLISETIMNFDLKDEGQYDSLRASAFIVQKLCNPYIWRIKDDEDPRALIETAARHLAAMIDTGNESICTFLNMWGDAPEVINSVKSQIVELNERRLEWKG